MTSQEITEKILLPVMKAMSELRCQHFRGPFRVLIPQALAEHLDELYLPEVYGTMTIRKRILDFADVKEVQVDNGIDRIVAQIA